MSSYTIFFISPTVERPGRCGDSGMTTATGNFRHHESDQSFDAFGSGRSSFVAMTELPIHAPTPGVQITRTGNRSRMIRTTADLNDHLTSQTLSDARDVFPAVVTMPQASIVPAAPGKDFAIGRQDDRVATAAGNLSNSHTAERVDVRRFILIARVAQAQLTIFAAA